MGILKLIRASWFMTQPWALNDAKIIKTSLSCWHWFLNSFRNVYSTCLSTVSWITLLSYHLALHGVQAGEMYPQERTIIFVLLRTWETLKCTFMSCDWGLKKVIRHLIRSLTFTEKQYMCTCGMLAILIKWFHLFYQPELLPLLLVCDNVNQMCYTEHH